MSIMHRGWTYLQMVVERERERVKGKAGAVGS